MVLPQAELLNRYSVNISEGSREGLERKGLTYCKEELWVYTDKGIAGLRITGEAEERLESLKSRGEEHKFSGGGQVEGLKAYIQWVR